MKPNDKAIEAGFNACTTVSRSIVIDILTAAYAAQFQSEDYAGLVKQGRIKSMMLQMNEPIAFGSDSEIIDKLSDALEALLAERDALKAENERMKQSLPLWAHKQMAANSAIIERLRAERNAPRTRLAPVGDEVLEAKAAAAIIAVEHNGIDDEFILEARAAIAATRPHIEAAERERCAKAVEKVAGRINVPLHERPAYEDGYLQGVHDAATAIRSGK